MRLTVKKPVCDPEARYSITQTCELLGIHRDTLRDYTDKKYLIKCGLRRLGNKVKKYYLGSEILRFWQSQI